MTQTTIELQPRLAAHTELESRAKLLAHLGNGWHLAEFGIALGAGITAGSVALTSFAGDSLVEVLAALAIVWLFSAGRGGSEQTERRAQQLIAGSYFLLVGYIVSHAPRFLGHRQRGRPEPGLCLPLGRAPRRASPQRRRRLVVGRPGRRPCHRRLRTPRRTRKLARPSLRMLLSRGLD